MTKETELEEDVDFEIQFYEGILRRQPRFVQALSALGDAYTKQGRYQDGLAIDERLVKLQPEDPIVLYNLACSYSLLMDIDKAFVFVKKAINRGYCDFEHLKKDVDLINLRKDSRFQRYFSKL